MARVVVSVGWPCPAAACMSSVFGTLDLDTESGKTTVAEGVCTACGARSGVTANVERCEFSPTEGGACRCPLVDLIAKGNAGHADGCSEKKKKEGS